MNLCYRRLIEEQHLAHCAEKEIARREEELGKVRLQSELHAEQAKLAVASGLSEREKQVCEELRGRLQLLNAEVIALKAAAKPPSEALFANEGLRQEITLLRNENLQLRSEVAETRQRKNEDGEIAALGHELNVKERLFRQSQAESEEHRRAAEETKAFMEGKSRLVLELQGQLNSLRQENNHLRLQALTLEDPTRSSPYEDPVLLAANKRLIVEVEQLTAEEQKMRRKLAEAETAALELRHRVHLLQSMLAEERAGADRIMARRDQVAGEERSRFRRGLKNFTGRLWRREKQVLRPVIFRALYLNALLSKMKRIQHEAKDKIAVRQRLEVVDGTLAVFRDLRLRLLQQIQRVFMFSSDSAFKRKCASLQLFAKELAELRRNDCFVLSAALAFTRLKRLVAEALPRSKKVLVSCSKEEFMPNEKDDLFAQEENGQPHAGEKWLMRLLQEALKTRRKTAEDRMLFLYRLLTIIHRADNPPPFAQDRSVSSDFREVLSTKIVSALFSCLHPRAKEGSESAIPQRNKRPATAVGRSVRPGLKG